MLKLDGSDLPVPAWSDQAPKLGTMLATVGPDEHPLSIGTMGSRGLSILRDAGQLGFSTSANDGDADGVVVSEILFALTNEILKIGDVITEFNDISVRNQDDFRREERRFLGSRAAIVGGKVPVRVRREKSTLELRIPIESSSEADKSRPLGDAFAPLAHFDLQGRHTGFDKVFMHDALVSRPRPTDVFTPYISRKDFGSPVVNLSGEIVGLNIGSHEGYFAYAIPTHVLQQIVVELRSSPF